jgi:hypothetical protein
VASWSGPYPANDSPQTWHELWVGTSVDVGDAYLLVVDAQGNGLCVPKAPGSVQGQGITVGGGGEDASVNGPLVITTPATATEVSVSGTIGDWQSTLPVHVVASASTTSFSAEILETVQSDVTLRLRVMVGQNEVLGGHLLVENLTPSVLQIDSPQRDGTTVSQLDATDPLFTVGRVSSQGASGVVYAQGTGQLRVSAPGTTLSPTTLQVVFPNQ